MAEKRRHEKLVKTKRKNSPVEDWPIQLPSKKQKINEACEKMIEFLKSKQSEPQFEQKCSKIYEIFSE